MIRSFSVAVFVVAVLALHQCTWAQSGVTAIRSVPPEPAPQMSSPLASPVSGAGQTSPTSRLSAATALAKFTAKRTGESRMPEGAFNGFAQHRLQPDLGAPGSAGNGFHHFPMPMDKYTNWYRPKAASLTLYQRCAPESFRPRGFGNLFAEPADGFRMDYEPYSLSDGLSTYGPAYPARMPDPRCNDCDHCDDDECQGNCQHCRQRPCR